MRVIPPTPIIYSPFLCAAYVRAKVLFMAAPEDEMVHANYGVTRQVYDLISTDKRWYDIRDGHFGLLYHPGERFDEAVDVQVEYLLAQARNAFISVPWYSAATWRLTASACAASASVSRSAAGVGSESK